MSVLMSRLDLLSFEGRPPFLYSYFMNIYLSENASFR